MRSSRYIVLERKSMPIVAWYVVSNESYMNRVIRDVLPTVEPVRNARCSKKVKAGIPYHFVHRGRRVYESKPISIGLTTAGHDKASDLLELLQRVRIRTHASLRHGRLSRAQEPAKWTGANSQASTAGDQYWNRDSSKDSAEIMGAVSLLSVRS